MPATSTLEKVERTVIHLEIGGAHHYFGSIANMFEYFTMAHYVTMGCPVRNLIRIVNVPFAKVSCYQKVEVEVVRNK